MISPAETIHEDLLWQAARPDAPPQRPSHTCRRCGKPVRLTRDGWGHTQHLSRGHTIQPVEVTP